MFICVTYKDAPELFGCKKRTPISSSPSEDLSSERILLVNPDCHIRVMLEYIRNKCKLGPETYFDISDENGVLKNLFLKPHYMNGRDLFDCGRMYYLIVLKADPSERKNSIIPQVNRVNRMYAELKIKVNRFMVTGEVASASGGLSPEGKDKTKKKKGK